MTRTYPYGYRSAAPGWPAEMLTADQLMSKAPWARLHPEVRRRHLAIFDAAQDAGTMLGIGGGWRSAAQQEATFRARYDTTPRPNAKSKVTWNGQVWYIKSNNLAPSTPPGRSWHEESPEVIDNMTEAWAYAVDTIGDWAFLKAHCARFGLVEFSEVNDEPWHTQPVELPIARRNYAGQVLRVFPLPGLPVVIDPPKPPPPVPEDNMAKRTLFIPTDCDAQFIGWADDDGNALEVWWADKERADAHRAAGVVIRDQLSFGGFRNCVLLGPLPHGDSRHQWDGSEFFRVVS